MRTPDPGWYKDSIIYELHVRAFQDSIGDGMGDFVGLTQKLDYLQDLGITAIWLLPFYPSPLKDDGYDIADYVNIHPHYGTLRDFQEFLIAAHQRGLRVITELVINHTSDQHPWFQRARRSPPGTPERDFYVWSDTPEKYKEARIIFKDFESSNWSWDPVAKAYYWHRFYSHQPDLNYDNPAVWNAIFPVVDFWFGMGVDGMRLDAVPYLYEREGTNCENLAETHGFLRALRKHVDERFPDRMLLAEANQWPEDAVAYFGTGDECHMAFHFPLMPRMLMAIHMEDRFPVLDILAQTPVIPDNCQWGLFLRNHDELTLEMVTDEERDYMYRAYAHDPQARINLGIRRRLAPLLGNNRRRIELMNGLLFSLPGTPVLYYGDEIGMGDNIYLGDRNSVRTPMQWSADRNGGFSRANPQKLYLPVIIDPEYHYEAINVEAQQNNPNSLLWWMKRLIAVRKRYKAFGRGTFEPLYPENRKILAFLRRYQEECILVVANLSRFVQYLELDLSRLQGQVPVELFGGTPFPPIRNTPYVLSLGPHAFYWFALTPQGGSGTFEGLAAPEAELPEIVVRGAWENVFQFPARDRLEEVLRHYLGKRRWFRGKARAVKAAVWAGAFRLALADAAAFLCLIEVEFTQGPVETYLLPLTFAAEEPKQRQLTENREFLVARLTGGATGVLYDALASPRFCSALLQLIEQGQTLENHSGALLRASAFAAFTPFRNLEESKRQPALSRAEQDNTSVIFGSQMILKVFRRVEEGINPELEVGRFLTEHTTFAHKAPVLGALEYQRRRRAEPLTLAVLHAYVPNEGNAWQYTLDALSRFYERALTSEAVLAQSLPMALSLVELAAVEASAQVLEMLDTYLETARLLGQRTAELHRALASAGPDPSMTPEPFTMLYQRSVYQSMRNLVGQVIPQLIQQLPALPEAARRDGRLVLDQQERIMQRFQQLRQRRIGGHRIRVHGDYHLGQLLYTGKDFVVIDWEGDPLRPLSDRRLKRSPLRDVASMVRSFHYAAYSALFGLATPRGQLSGLIRPEDQAVLEPWARFWSSWVSATFLKSYREATGTTAFLPQAADEFKILIETFLLEKAIRELSYELTYRPDWVRIPLLGILELLEA